MEEQKENIGKYIFILNKDGDIMPLPIMEETDLLVVDGVVYYDTEIKRTADGREGNIYLEVDVEDVDPKDYIEG